MVLCLEVDDQERHGSSSYLVFVVYLKKDGLNPGLDINRSMVQKSMARSLRQKSFLSEEDGPGQHNGDVKLLPLEIHLDEVTRQVRQL